MGTKCLYSSRQRRRICPAPHASGGCHPLEAHLNQEVFRVRRGHSTHGGTYLSKVQLARLIFLLRAVSDVIVFEPENLECVR